MGLILRKMEDDDAKAVQLLGIKSFLRSGEGFYVSRPKTAWVAEKEGEIVGGFLYAIEESKGKKLGFIDYFFVKPEYAGQGIGRALCEDAISHLWAEGCDYLVTFVRDDNVGSWRVFEKTGFTRASLPKCISELGIGGFIKVYLKHVYGFCLGCDLFFAVCPENSVALSAFTKKTGFGQMLLYVLTNIALLLVLIIASTGIMDIISNPSILTSQLPIAFLSFGSIFVGIIIFSYIGTLFSGRKWQYRMPTGGILLSGLFSVFGMFLPIAGNWYPQLYENTAKLRASLGISATLSWLYLMGLFVIARLFGEDIRFLGVGFQMTIFILLIFRCIPFPSINLGSVRVFRWNKILCALMVLVTIFLLFVW
jgi:ribosomal protein S18 acetylase RimI-like enzyme